MKPLSPQFFGLVLTTLIIAVLVMNMGANSSQYFLIATAMGIGGIAIGFGTYRLMSRSSGGHPNWVQSAFLGGTLAGIFGILCTRVVIAVWVLRDGSPLPPYGDVMPELILTVWNGLIVGGLGFAYGTGMGQEPEQER